MSKKIIIAIDGPAGSGKSTAAKNLAQKLGFIYVDTGAMYRAITYIAMQRGIVDDIKAVIDMMKNLDISLKFENGVTRVFVNGEEITDFIRTQEVNSKVSDISVIPQVREELVKLQRQMGAKGNLIAEGRDTTTVVFPQADIKVFLTATLDERAKRRYKEYLEKNINTTLDEVRDSIANRDRIDSGREVSPLRKADDAIEIDNSNTPIEEEIEFLLKKISEIRD